MKNKASQFTKKEEVNTFKKKREEFQKGIKFSEEDTQIPDFSKKIENHNKFKDAQEAEKKRHSELLRAIDKIQGR